MITPLKRLSSSSPVRGTLFCMLLILLLPYLTSSNTQYAHSEERNKWLIWAGLDLFPSLLAADMNITQKKTRDGKLLLHLAYVDDRQAAVEMAQYLQKIERIRDIPVRIEPCRSDSLLNSPGPRPAGIFLTQQMGPDLQTIIRYGRENHIIVFSPFEADVERGVLGGIVVREKILPYINVMAMRSADIEIKPFFLRIAKRYE